jgi:Na+/melibiose symporter-like transporter
MHQTDRLEFGRLAAFSLPVVLFQTIELGWRTYLPAFLTQSVGLSFAAVGLLMIGARSFDSVADPVIGWLSDQLRSRHGRRRPWMIAGVPFISAGALALFLAPGGAAFTFVLVASLALHLGYSLIVTPHGGWAFELSRDPHERTRIMGAKVWFAGAGMLLILAILAILERRFGFDRAGLTAVIGIIIALLAPISVLVVVALFRERRDLPPPDRRDPLKLVREMMRERRLRTVLALYMLGGGADACAMGSFLFFAENLLGLHGWGASLLLIQPVLVIMILPAWSELSRRIGREHTLMIAYGWQMLVAPLALLLPHGGLLPLAAYLVLRNLSWGVDYMLLRAMVADIADRDATRDARNSGSYYALTSTTLKLAMGMGAAAAVWAIGLSGFDAAKPISDTAQWTIRAIYALSATCASGIGLALLARSRSTERAHSSGALLELRV